MQPRSLCKVEICEKALSGNSLAIIVCEYKDLLFLEQLLITWVSPKTHNICFFLENNTQPLFRISEELFRGILMVEPRGLYQKLRTSHKQLNVKH